MKRLFFSSLILSVLLAAPPALFAQQAKPAAAAPEVKVISVDELKGLLARGGAGKEARPLLVNFWATWCEPCRAEMPELVRIDQDFRARGLDLILVSIDDVADVKTTVPQFLTEMKAARLSSYLLSATDPDAAIAAIDPEWPGALPATFLYDGGGKLTYRHIGLIKPEELRAALEKTFGPK
ncbi:MAG TPA: TlpA disulfide reductase family protein [Pyrinomonadaceae bacterium]|jgi:thiol-disulfide isomerase/thioredoxin|nr:TlpA disulfide reductase family protein [Pyrinomonadaceae bacterium]